MVIPRLSQDIKNELPGINGFSVTNIKRMTLFYREYTNSNLIGPQAVGQIDSILMNIGPNFRFLVLNIEIWVLNYHFSVH
jgi:hypothetical protein